MIVSFQVLWEFARRPERMTEEEAFELEYKDQQDIGEWG